jgi:hypothetical protein
MFGCFISTLRRDCVNTLMRHSPVASLFAPSFRIGCDGCAFSVRLGILGGRLLTFTGFLLAALAQLLFLRLPVEGDYATQLLPALLVNATAMGFIMVPLAVAALDGISDKNHGVASGLLERRSNSAAPSACPPSSPWPRPGSTTRPALGCPSPRHPSAPSTSCSRSQLSCSLRPRR